MELYDRFGNLVTSPKKRSRAETHAVSDSDYEQDSDGEYASGGDYYRDPSAFLRKFSGYHSDEKSDPQFLDEDDNENEDKYDESDNDNEEVCPVKKPFRIPKIKRPPQTGVSEGADW